MPRRREVPKRIVLPDPKYKEEVIAKFANVMMRDGKKSTAEKIVYGALEMVAERSKSDALEIFRKAIDNVRPVVEVKSRRVGGATYQVPVEIRSDRRMAWPCAGCATRRVSVTKSPWAIASRRKFSKRPKIAVMRFASARRPTVWLKPIRPLHISAGNWLHLTHKD
jgi:SSU ribosomal protein S7P